MQYSWISDSGKAAYRHTEYGSGKSGKIDTDIVFVESEKESMGKLNTVLNIQLRNMYRSIYTLVIFHFISCTVSQRSS